MQRELLTTLEAALLGLLDRSTCSGYDISRLFTSTPLAHFSSSPGAIYPALKRLERSGLVTASLDTTTATRPRRLYVLTEAGAAALNAWVRQPVTRDELVRDGRAPILRFSLAEGHLSSEELIAYLAGFRREVATYLEELAPYRQEMARKSTLHQRQALEHGIRSYESQLAWTDETIRLLEQDGQRPRDRDGDATAAATKAGLPEEPGPRH
jgi:DNA-binding PadR family transcriptional regulator